MEKKKTPVFCSDYFTISFASKLPPISSYQGNVTECGVGNRGAAALYSIAFHYVDTIAIRYLL